jgi:hypothetical protein
VIIIYTADVAEGRTDPVLDMEDIGRNSQKKTTAFSFIFLFPLSRVFFQLRLLSDQPPCQYISMSLL